MISEMIVRFLPSKQCLILLIFFLITIIYLYLKYIYSYWERKGIPYIKPSIPFGNAKPLIFGKESVGRMIAKVYKELKAKGEAFGGYYTLSQPVFIPIDPELIKTILIKDFDSFCERGLHYDEEVDPLSAHLVAVRNPKWRFLRTKFSPLFTPTKLKMVFATMITCEEDLSEVLKISSQNDEPINIRDLMARFSTDMIGSSAFGITCNSVKNPDAEFRKCGKEFFRASLRNSLVLTLALFAKTILKLFKIPITKPSTAKFFLNVINETIEYREKNKTKHNDMMDLLIKLKNNENIDDEITSNEKTSSSSISFNQLAAQAFVFYLAGFESISSITMFCLYEVILNKSIQQKMKEEIKEVLSKYGGNVTYGSITAMTYMDQVINETMRKYPPIPILNRECIKDFKIPGTDKVIEKGTKVVISLLGMHNDPKYFQDPEKFDPERFSEDRKSEIQPNTFMPWGIGPRSCIAYKYGYLSIKIGLTILLKDYTFLLHSKTSLPLSLSKKKFMMDFDEILWVKAIQEEK